MLISYTLELFPSKQSELLFVVLLLDALMLLARECGWFGFVVYYHIVFILIN